MRRQPEKVFQLLFWSTLYFVLTIPDLCCATDQDRKSPNIIFILADDLGWTDIQAGDSGPNVINGKNYGSKYYRTPNIARLASRGVSFTHCYAHPNCAPTRAAILSGQYAPRSGNGVYHVQRLNREAKAESPTTLIPPPQRQDVPAEHTIFPELLRKAGYSTCHIGKYHVGGKEGGKATLPLQQGFDFNFGGTDKGGPKNYFAKNQKFSDAVSPSLDQFGKKYSAAYLQASLASAGTNTKQLIGTEKHIEDAVGDAAIHFIKQHTLSKANRPFYLQVHHFAVHSPTGSKHARKDLLTKYQQAKKSKHHKHASYAAILENLDQTVGRILDCLDDPNGDGNRNDSIRSKTTIIFTSDNGGITPSDNYPLRHVKGSFYEGGIRVPLIVDGGNETLAGKQSDTLIHCVDYYPTILDVAGIAKPDELTLDGESFWNVASEFAKRNREPIFYHFPGYLDRRARPCSVIIRRCEEKDYKLIYNYDTQYTGKPKKEEFLKEGLKALSQPWELYCLTDEVSEQTNLFGTSKQHNSIANEMAALLNAWLNQPDADWKPKPLIERSTNKPVVLPELKLE